MTTNARTLPSPITLFRLALIAVVLLLGLHAYAEGAAQGANAEKTLGAEASASQAAASVSPGEVGVEEKLGQTALLDLMLRDEAGNPVNLRSPVDSDPQLLPMWRNLLAAAQRLSSGFESHQCRPGQGFSGHYGQLRRERYRRNCSA